MPWHRCQIADRGGRIATLSAEERFELCLKLVERSHEDTLGYEIRRRRWRREPCYTVGRTTASARWSRAALASESALRMSSANDDPPDQPPLAARAIEDKRNTGKTSDGWCCAACGALNAAAETFCDACGSERDGTGSVFRPGEIIAGWRVRERLDIARFAVEREDGAERGVLLCGAPAEIEAVAGTLTLLAGDCPALLLPRVAARRADTRYGECLVLALPAGLWRPLADAEPGCVLLIAPRDEPFPPVGAFSSAALLPPRRAENPYGAAAYLAAMVLLPAVGPRLGWPAALRQTLALITEEESMLTTDDHERLLALLDAASSPETVGGHRAAWLSDIGHHHSVNQDAGGAWTWRRADGTPVTLAVVCDGVSASERSDEAARIAIDTLREAVEAVCGANDFTPDRAVRLLADAAEQAHRQISAIPVSRDENASATTLVAACAVGGEVVGIWCGDSRAYGLGGGAVTALTRDHSWVNLMIASGRMTREQAQRDPRGHVIVRWLGAGPTGAREAGVETFRCTLAPGERLLLCSDGLYMYFEPPAGEPEEMARIVAAHDGDVEGAVAALVREALARGGYDNITAALIEMLPA